MDLRAELLSENSKKQTLKLAAAIIGQPEQFAQLMSYFLNDEGGGYLLPQRAAAVVNEVGAREPDLLQPYFEKMILDLRNDIHDAVKRNTVRLLQYHDLPESLLGEAADICFGLLQSAKEPVAVKVFSMTVLYNIVRRVPELKSELAYSIEEQMAYGSAGFVSRGKKVLHALKLVH